MGYYVRTDLKCTNPELISSGSTFNEEWSHELKEIKNGVTSYCCKKQYLNDAVKELSKSHPTETFTGRTWINDNILEYRIYTAIIKNGIESIVDVEPGYSFLFPPIDDEEYQSLIEEFKKHVDNYLKRIDLFHKGSDQGFEYNFLNDKVDDNGFKSYYTITWGNDKHIFTATRRYPSLVMVDYQRKISKDAKKNGSGKRQLIPLAMKNNSNKN